MTAVATFATIDLDRADAVILDSPYADRVEDSEITGAGVVYTLEDGSTVTVNHDESITHNP